ncbi:uncharacterized protein LOC144124658 isoform X3 [Amblyomma americanum]
MEKVHRLWLPVFLLFAAPLDALTTDQPCNFTQVRDCYRGILGSVVAELSQQKLDPNLHENICKKYSTTSECQADMAPCLPSFPELKDMERLYSSIRQEACGDVTFSLLRYVKCPKNGKRATYARKTLATLMEIRGGDACDGSPSLQYGGQPQGGTAGGQEGADGEQCWYKTLKRCNERQINDIRTKMTRLLARNMLPDENFFAGICRKTRKTCHQHSTVKSCVTQEQDAIRRLEEAMNEAQALLCKDDRRLLKNLLLSYKSWDIKHFTKCSTHLQVNSITDFLYNRPRIHSDCRLLKSRLFRCLNESYAAADEADPKPDVDGARKVLAIFVDKITCVDAGDLVLDDGTSGPDDKGDTDYPAEEAGGNTTDANAMPVMPGAAESGAIDPAIRKLALVGFVSLMMALTRYLTPS